MVLVYCLLVILGIAFVLAVVFLLVYGSRLKTLKTIRKMTSYEDGYDLYSMTVAHDYSTENIIKYGIKDTQDSVNAILKESLPLLPIKMKIPSFGCSVYRAITDEKDTVMGRNYDFKLNTSCMMVRCNPKKGYRSIAFAALDNIMADHADESMKTKMACITAPFICLDGVNEKGVSIAVLTLDSEPTDQKNGRPKITSSLAIRMVLDTAASTQEAVDLLKKYDMLSVNGRDYHLFISDASGDSRVIEYDPEDAARPLIETPMCAVTNFYGRYIDKVLPNQKNGIYGHGKERYDRIMEVINRCGGVLDSESRWEALKVAASEPNPESVTSNTQWSIVFNNTKGTADIVLRRHWGDMYSFSIK